MAALTWTLTVLSLSLLCGCGSIREKRATDQLLLSDAVDRSVASIDFSAFSGEKVFLDTRYLQLKNSSVVTTNYVISSLRQQMIVAGCLLQDKVDSSDYVVEARVGTLGSDSHDINYGIPASNSVNAAATVISGVPPLPALPEISLARRSADMAAVKIAAFAYHRDSRQPVWQSGNSLAKSEASGLWVLGAGPFKRGSIYEGTQFAGREVGRRLKINEEKTNLGAADHVFRDPTVWDPKLREKLRNGDHLLTPTDGEAEREVEAVTAKEVETEKG